MRDRVRIVGEEVLSDNWGLLKRTTFDFQRRSGEWQRQIRETYDRGHAAAVLLHDPERGTVVLVKQFRFPNYADGRDGWLLEVCAGLLDGDDAETCARRESEEEAGFRVKTLVKTFDADMSPGSVIETISCFVGTFDPASRVSAGGGLEHEGEDIEVVELPLTKALKMIDDGRITDGKSILLLQWLALHPLAG